MDAEGKRASGAADCVASNVIHPTNEVEDSCKYDGDSETEEHNANDGGNERCTTLNWSPKEEAAVDPEDITLAVMETRGIASGVAGGVVCGEIDTDYKVKTIVRMTVITRPTRTSLPRLGWDV